jgi:predicted enzyme related to lactoylglutathione lyase
VSDVNSSLAFYSELLGAPPNGNATGPRQFAPNEVVSNLYNTPGSLFRGGTVRIAGTELGGAELVDWQVGERKRVQPRIQDAGAATLILNVRDIAAAGAALGKNGGSILTPKAEPVLATVHAGKGRMLLGRDPDGFLIGVMQLDSPPAETTAPATSNVVGASLLVTVADLDKAVRFYRDALGFDLARPTPWETDKALADLAGLPKGAQRRSASALIPGTALPVEFIEFKGIERKVLGADAHGVGSSVLRLRVKDIDATIAALKAGGASVASANGEPVTFANGQRMAIVSDPNGIFVQTVQAAPPQTTPAAQPARGTP